MSPPPEAPVFAAPWQAQAFAIALSLHGRGLFAWPEFSAALARQIAAADGQGDYHSHWLAALETLVAAKAMASPQDLRRCRDAWAHAARRTPHGRPIELCADDYAAAGSGAA